MGTLPHSYLINWGFLRIGPPYIFINIDPVLLHLGPLAIRWYGLMYVIGILVGLRVIKGYTERKGVSEEKVYSILWWCIAAGLLGGRLYFVIQQPDFVPDYLLQPQHILATWEGGMAFFGAIFLVIPTLFWRARVKRLNPLVLVDAAVLLAAAGQIFGRIGNLINGDIIGYPARNLPWSTVYQHPQSWACLDPNTCNVPVQPAAGYELLANLVVLATLLFLARRVTRPGILMLVYLYCYCVTQFFLFFTRDNLIVNFLGLNWGLKQAQWTALVLFIVLLPVTYWVARVSRPIPQGEVAATYGIPQLPDAAEPIPSDTTSTATEDASTDSSVSTAEQTIQPSSNPDTSDDPILSTSSTTDTASTLTAQSDSVPSDLSTTPATSDVPATTTSDPLTTPADSAPEQSELTPATTKGHPARDAHP